MSLRRTPVERPDGAELVRRIARETAELPPTRIAPPPPQPMPPDPTPIAPRMAPQIAPQTATEQINFRGSPGLARLLARLAADQGIIRLVIARLLQAAGHDVPDTDLAPPPGRRRLG